MPAETDVLAKGKAALDDEGFEWAGNAVPVNVRKLPRAKKLIDTPPVICLCPSDEAGPVTWLAPRRKSIGHVVDVISITPGKMDYSDANLEDITGWRERIRKRLVDRFRELEVTGLHRVEVRQMPTLDRSLLQDGYDYSGQRFVFHVIEEG